MNVKYKSRGNILNYQILPFVIDPCHIPFLPLLEIEYIHAIRPPTVPRAEVLLDMRIGEVQVSVKPMKRLATSLHSSIHLALQVHLPQRSEILPDDNIIIEEQNLVQFGENLR